MIKSSADIVLNTIKAAGVECYAQFCTSGTVIVVRIEKSDDCVKSILPLDKESHGRFADFLIAYGKGLIHPEIVARQYFYRSIINE